VASALEASAEYHVRSGVRRERRAGRVTYVTADGATLMRASLATIESAATERWRWIATSNVTRDAVVLSRLPFVIATLALACQANPIAHSRSPLASDTEVYAVYSEVIDSLWLRRRALPIAVIDTTTLDPPLRLQASGPLSRMLDSTSPGLRDALASAVQTRGPLRPAFSVSGEVTLVPRSAVATLGDPRRAAAGATYVAFSAIGFSSDRRSAAVYAEYHCGALCGGAYVIVLARHPPQSWRIRQVHTILLF
jgi:hypothetical protein